MLASAALMKQWYSGPLFRQGVLMRTCRFRRLLSPRFRFRFKRLRCRCCRGKTWRHVSGRDVGEANIRKLALVQ